MTEQMREDFEAWYFDGAIDKAKERTPHGYKYIAAQASWLAWNAATLAERERCAKVCDDEAADLVDILEMQCATEFGKQIKTAMSKGALNCAAIIRQGGAG